MNLLWGSWTEALTRLSRSSISFFSRPQLGHPYGPTALVSENTKLTDMIDALGERGMIVEGELGLEVGPGGKQIRTSLKFKPQEGLLSKIINRFSLNLDLKDFLNRH